MESQSPALASHSSMEHASFGAFGSSLASHSRVADMGNHCPEGRVHLMHGAVARRGMFIAGFSKSFYFCYSVNIVCLFSECGLCPISLVPLFFVKISEGLERGECFFFEGI